MRFQWIGQRPASSGRGTSEIAPWPMVVELVWRSASVPHKVRIVKADPTDAEAREPGVPG
jgi:hypothetical protein